MPLLTLRNNLARVVDLTPAAALPRVASEFVRPLRIALVTEYYYPHLGGICEHVHFFAREARRLGHHVDIITSNLEGAVAEPHVIRIGRSQPVYFNGSQARMTVGLSLRKDMRKTLKRGNYDVVHVHSPLSPWLPLLAMDEAECPVVGTFHTYFERSVLYGVTRRALQRKLDRLHAAIAVSHSTTVALNRYFEANWTIVPNGIDLDLFNPHVPPPPGIRRDVPVILFLGRFDPRNGLTTLIDSFKRVRGRNREAQLVVVGDGPLRKHYYRAAGGDPNITFVGAVLGSRPSYYAHSSIYACPTTKASFGITLLESMACETPVVCSDILGFRDVVKHEREALMFHCGDRDALADSLVRLLDDETLRARLGKTGRLHAQKYGWPSVTEAVLDVYMGVLGHNRMAV
ncbi:MAG TPA: glycosyltransferase family 4 protein [Gemmatimonadaceae bacterium]|nr:glycosyltransferase family 4 protein [Gemmatimonadaceae bacterium]